MNVQIAIACIVVAVILWKLVHLLLRKWNKYLFKRTNFPELLFSFANCGEHFTAFLNIHSGIVGDIKVGKGGFEFFYKIPRHLSTEQGVLDLGGVLALADEISTVLLCSQDKTHRAGVSVSLTGEILRPEILKAGETVYIETIISKVGAALGFAELIIWKSSDRNEVVARVSHIKYMLTGGKLWDIVSPLFPSLLLLAKRFGWGGNTLRESEYLTLSQLLDVKCNTAEKLNSHFELVSHHKIQNLFKFLHGGALTMAITDAVNQFHDKSQQESGGKRVCPQSLRWMEMQYMSPCKGKISISIVPQVSTKNGKLPSDNSLEGIHSFRVMVYASKSKGNDRRQCLAQGSVLFY